MEIFKMNNNTLSKLGFSGSYQPEDITFLMNIAAIQPTSVQEKESLIQSGQAHYSQMISAENKPTNEHLKHYKQALKIGAYRMGQDIQKLGNSLMQRFKDEPIILVSLVRAGVPVGVLLKHHISKSQKCYHYGISIIRDRGIDYCALNAIIDQHGAKNIVFVDGWTGKGAICKELTKSLQSYPDLFDEHWDIPRLVTLADLGGCSWLSASCDDWLIPSGILGSVVSGLTSRSILLQDISEESAKTDFMNVDNWHKCIIYNELSDHDLSLEFINHILNEIQKNPTQDSANWSNEIRLDQQQLCCKTIKWVGSAYDIQDVNRIKPSIAEATRAVLRRIPDRILIKDADDENVQLLLHFAKENNVPVDVVGNDIGPYQAITLIKRVSGN